MKNRNQNVVTTRVTPDNLKKLDQLVASSGKSRNEIVNSLLAALTQTSTQEGK